jgi:hypothetical protein
MQPTPATTLVESAWGAVSGLFLVRFPRPLAEPAVPVSRQRALHGACRRLLRQPTGAGLSPPLKQQRLTAHEAGPQRVPHHVLRPHLNKMITDQTISTVYLIDEGILVERLS